jgi:hypothetical protein
MPENIPGDTLYGFAAEGDIEAVLRLISKAPPTRYTPTPSTSGPMSCFVRVTGAKDTGNGYYPGIIVYPHNEIIPAGTWYDGDIVQVQSGDGSQLTSSTTASLGPRYSARIMASYSGVAIAVTANSSTPIGRGKIVSRIGDGIYTIQPLKRTEVGTASITGTGTGWLTETAWTNDGDVITPCFRLPTQDDSPPTIPVGEGVLWGIDSVGFWLTPWGGQKKFSITLVRAVYCDTDANGNPIIVNVVRDWDISARDLCVRESSG